MTPTGGSGADRCHDGGVSEPRPGDELPEDFAFLYSADELAEIERRRIVIAPVTAGPAPVGSGGAPDQGPDGGWDAGWDELDERAGAAGEPAPAGRARRLGASGAVLAGVMLGMGDALEAERPKQSVIEFAPDEADPDEQLVTFHMVKGDPRASRLVIRPWLLDRYRAARGARELE